MAIALCNTEPLMFWKGQESTLPGLAAMARDMLCVAGAGVGIERVFSKSRNVCHYQRGQLSPETIRAIMITSHHLQEESYNESIIAVQETMDVTNMTATDLQEEATQRIDDLEKSLKAEYISDDDGDLSDIYERSPTHIRRPPAGARQDLFWEDDDVEVVQQTQYQHTAAEIDALYNVPSSPPQQSHNTTQIQHELDLPQPPQSPSPHQARSSPSIPDRPRQHKGSSPHIPNGFCQRKESSPRLQDPQPHLRIAALTEQDEDIQNSQPLQLQEGRRLVEPVGLARTGRLLFPSEKARDQPTPPMRKRQKIKLVSAKQKAISSQRFYSKK